MKAKKSKTFSVPFRRKREGKTDYRKRIVLLKSGKDRLVVRKSIKNIIAQIVRYDPGGDKIMASATSHELKKYGLSTLGGNIPVAYLVGILIGKKAIKNGVKEAISDIGSYSSTKGSRMYAVIKGAIDAGLKIPVSPEILPSKERVEGKNIEAYAKILEEKKITGPFSEYQKNRIKASELSKYYEGIKQKIIGGA